MRAHEITPHDRVDYVIYVKGKPATVYDTRAQAEVDLDDVKKKHPHDAIVIKRRVKSERYHDVMAEHRVSRYASDHSPIKRGLSLREIHQLCEGSWSDHDQFDKNIRKNLNLPRHANTLELWGYYTRLRASQLQESESDNIEDELFQNFSELCRGALKDATVGQSVALLHLQTLQIPGDRVYARLHGFTSPKKIVDIVDKQHYKQLHFEGGEVYPESDDIFLTDIMQSKNMTKLFADHETVDKITLWYDIHGNKNTKKLDFKVKIDDEAPKSDEPTTEDVGSTPGGVGNGTKMFLEKHDGEAQPRVRRYENSRGERRWEVLDWQGVRHGPEFTNRHSAREYLERNRHRLEYREELDEDDARSTVWMIEFISDADKRKEDAARRQHHHRYYSDKDEALAAHKKLERAGHEPRTPVQVSSKGISKDRIR